jgi:hypothetical protein
MTAETLTSVRAAASFPAVQSHTAGAVLCAYGTYAVAANVEDGDIFAMLKLPKGSVVIGGWVDADAIDAHATATLDLDIGWAANGSDAANADGFGNLGVWHGDAVTNVRPEAYNHYYLGGVLKDGPVAFAAETTIQIEANAAAATFAAGDITLYVLYLTP